MSSAPKKTRAGQTKKIIRTHEEIDFSPVEILEHYFQEEGFQGASIRLATQTTLGNKKIEFSCSFCPKCSRKHDGAHGFYIVSSNLDLNAYGIELPWAWLGCTQAAKGTAKKTSMHPAFEVAYETMK